LKYEIRTIVGITNDVRDSLSLQLVLFNHCKVNVYLIGGAIFITVLVLSIFIWKKTRTNQFQWALIFILLIGLILRVFVSADSHLHEWDERYHALVSKHLSEHPLKPTLIENPVLEYDQKNWVGNHVWLAKPPLPLWFIAISTTIFGDNVYALRLPSLFFGLLSIYLTFLIGKYLFDQRIALLAAYLHAINGVIIELGGGRISSDHVETAFIFFVELALFLTICFFQKKPKYTITILIGIVTGLAFLCKWYPAALVFPVWFFGFISWKNYSLLGLIKHGFVFIVSAFVVAFPWVYYSLTNYPEEAKFVLGQILGAYISAAENHAAPFYYYWKEILFLFGELIYLILGFSVYQLIKKRNTQQNLILLAWALIPLIIFSFAETKRHTYLLIAAPAFFILTSQLWFTLLDFTKSAKMKWVYYLVMVALLILPLRLMIERVKIFEEKAQNKFMTELPDLQSRFNSNTLAFGIAENIELMFYTDVHAAYAKIPNHEKLIELKNQGFDIWCFDGEEWNKFKATE